MPYGFLVSFDLVSNGIAEVSILFVPKYRFQFHQLLFADFPAHLHVTVFQVVHGQLLIAYRDPVNKTNKEDNYYRHNEYYQRGFRGFNVERIGMAVFLCGQGVGPCQCFDGLAHLLDQRMRLPVLLVDHLQSPS